MFGIRRNVGWSSISLVKFRFGCWMHAVRDAFITLMPLTFLGLVALLLQQISWGPCALVMEHLLGFGWQGQLSHVIEATHGMFSPLLSVLVAIHLARRIPKVYGDMPEIHPVFLSISAFANLMLFAVSDASVGKVIGNGGILLGIAVGMATTELWHVLLRSPVLRMARIPYDTEINFYYALRLTPVMVLTGICMFVVAQLWAMLPAFPKHALAPLVWWAQTTGPMDPIWILSTAATIANQLVWFFGIAGGNMLDLYGVDLFSPAGFPYTNALANRPLFDHFVLLGGSGATLGLIFAILLTVKHGPQRRVAWISSAIAAFNINESMLYGLPIVLNLTYFVPFLGIPLVLNWVAVEAVQSGWLTLHVEKLNWTTPPLLSGWILTESWHGVALQIFSIGLSTLLYMPFVRSAEARRAKSEAKAFKETLEVIVVEGQSGKSLVKRHDHVGMIARGLMADLRVDLKADIGACSLVFQPKHSSKDGSLVGVEALVRWKHARHGQISPMAMILLSEDSKDIHGVGKWVMSKACECKARWNRMGYKNLVLSINVSPLQLTDPEFPENLRRALGFYTLDMSEIELEITESAGMPDDAMVDQTLHRLVDMGVHLSMDDFGMGYSSLLYMRRFPMYAIKIDGSVTRDVLTNRTNADIIRTIVSLGKSQHVHVVAEYVETEEQRDYLAQLGCDVFQGYLYSAPLSEESCQLYFRSFLEATPEKEVTIPNERVPVPRLRKTPLL